MDIISLPIKQIIPYENNPRINDNAVEAVAESIKQCGYCSPIVIDENNIILAGHTRLKALISLGYEKAECVRKQDMTEEQKRKYRLLDNKTSELADWDFQALEMELENIDFEGFDFGFASFDNEKDDVALDLDDDERDSEKNQSDTYYCPKCGFEFEVQK